MSQYSIVRMMWLSSVLPSLKLNLISAIGVGVLKQEIKAACVRLPSLFVLQHQVAEPQNPRIVCHAVLNPALVELDVLLQPNAIMLDEFHGPRSSVLSSA
jgi:hypothetical protein